MKKIILIFFAMLLINISYFDASEIFASVNGGTQIMNQSTGQSCTVGFNGMDNQNNQYAITSGSCGSIGDSVAYIASDGTYNVFGEITKHKENGLKKPSYSLIKYDNYAPKNTKIATHSGIINVVDTLDSTYEVSDQKYALLFSGKDYKRYSLEFYGFTDDGVLKYKVLSSTNPTFFDLGASVYALNGKGAIAIGILNGLETEGDDTYAYVTPTYQIANYSGVTTNTI